MASKDAQLKDLIGQLVDLLKDPATASVASHPDSSKPKHDSKPDVQLDELAECPECAAGECELHTEPLQDAAKQQAVLLILGQPQAHAKEEEELVYEV